MNNNMEQLTEGHKKKDELNKISKRGISSSKRRRYV